MQAAITETTSMKSSERQFALCESCFWSATIFGKSKEGIYACPACAGGNVSLLPLAKDEKYQVSITQPRGIEMSFSRARKP